MPVRPKSPCPRCRRVRCVCPPAEMRERKPWAQRPAATAKRRRVYVTSRERKRRKSTVEMWLNQNQRGYLHGKPCAICPECHELRNAFVADHVVPIAVGGDEGGPLRVHCRSCSNRQGGRIGRRVQHDS